MREIHLSALLCCGRPQSPWPSPRHTVCSRLPHTPGRPGEMVGVKGCRCELGRAPTWELSHEAPALGVAPGASGVKLMHVRELGCTSTNPHEPPGGGAAPLRPPDAEQSANAQISTRKPGQQCLFFPAAEVFGQLVMEQQITDFSVDSLGGAQGFGLWMVFPSSMSNDLVVVFPQRKDQHVPNHIICD